MVNWYSQYTRREAKKSVSNWLRALKRINKGNHFLRPRNKELRQEKSIYSTLDILGLLKSNFLESRLSSPKGSLNRLRNRMIFKCTKLLWIKRSKLLSVKSKKLISKKISLFKNYWKIISSLKVKVLLNLYN